MNVVTDAKRKEEILTRPFVNGFSYTFEPNRGLILTGLQLQPTSTIVCVMSNVREGYNCPDTSDTEAAFFKLSRPYVGPGAELVSFKMCSHWIDAVVTGGGGTYNGTPGYGSLGKNTDFSVSVTFDDGSGQTLTGWGGYAFNFYPGGPQFNGEVSVLLGAAAGTPLHPYSIIGQKRTARRMGFVEGVRIESFTVS